MFRKLFILHREFAFHDVIHHESQIAQLFQYRPSLLPNIKSLQFLLQNSLRFSSTPIPNTTISSSISFSNRADIEAFQQKKQVIPIIESNEIDLTKLIRDTNPNKKYVHVN